MHPIITETVTFSSDSRLDALVCRPDDGEAHRAVIIIHDIFGVDEDIEATARLLAKVGYVAIAPDLFRHEPTPYYQAQRARSLSIRLSDMAAMMDAGAILRFLEGMPYAVAGRTSVVGYGRGGRLAFLAACRHPADIRACVTFYASPMSTGRAHEGQMMVALEEAPALECPVLLFYGDQDRSIPVEEREAVRHRLAELGKSFTLDTYTGIGHGSFCSASPSYSKRAAADTQGKMLQFIHQYTTDKVSEDFLRGKISYDQCRQRMRHEGLLEKWRGGKAKLWQYSVSHKMLSIGVELKGRDGNLCLTCGDTSYWRGPTGWNDSHLEIEQLEPDPSDIYADTVIVRDRTVDFEARGGLISLTENRKPLY